VLRFIVWLQPEEREALTRLAIRERRDARDQAALLIRSELEQRGLLLADGEQPAKGGSDERDNRN
jgi:hypothetical protein